MDYSPFVKAIGVHIIADQYSDSIKDGPNIPYSMLPDSVMAKATECVLEAGGDRKFHFPRRLNLSS